MGQFKQHSNIQATANTLTVCHQGFLSDSEAFQALSCEDEDQNRPWEKEKSAYERSANPHLQVLADFTQVNTNPQYETQTLTSTKQTDALEHTHPAHLTDKFKGQQMTLEPSVPVFPWIQHHTHTHTQHYHVHRHTHAAGRYTSCGSIKCCPDTWIAVSLLNLFKQCNEH